MNFLTLWQFDAILRGTECLGHLVLMNMISVCQCILRILKNLSKDIYGEQDEQDGDPAGNPSRLLSNLFSRFLASFNNLELSSLTFHF